MEGSDDNFGLRRLKAAPLPQITRETTGKKHKYHVIFDAIKATENPLAVEKKQHDRVNKSGSYHWLSTRIGGEKNSVPRRAPKIALLPRAHMNIKYVLSRPIYRC